MSTASSLSSARSRPDMLSPATGGLYLLTVAGRRIPFERMTEIDGSSLTFALATAAASAWGESSPHASRTALRACWSATHAGVWLAGDTRCAFVIIHPLGLMNQPVPVSRNGAGRMSFSPPPPQVTMTSEPTSATTRETAGFARSRASCTEISAAVEVTGRRRRRRSAPVIQERIERILYPARTKKKAPGGSPLEPSSCFLLQHLHRGFGLRLRLSHLAGLARGLGLTDQLRGVAAMRRLNSLTGSLTATRGLNILAARSLRILTSRGLNILTTRSLRILTARRLHVLLATPHLALLAPPRLPMLTRAY